MPKKTTKRVQTLIEEINHPDQRINIPTEELRDFLIHDEGTPPALYPRDSSLDPQLVWKGKDEQDRAGLAVPVVPIYIQEKIRPQTIILNFLARLRPDVDSEPSVFQPKLDFVDYRDSESDFKRKLAYYSHEANTKLNWSNRMILGDSLLVMTSLAEKEGLKRQVQMIYIDPPYGIKFGSNWQVSTRKRDVSDGRATDTTRQPEQVKAFRDTWQLGIHSYLSYLRDRLVVARELLAETGSVFVQIGDENLHLVRSLLDEVFGSNNFCRIIAFAKTTGQTDNLLASVSDYLLWYAKDREQVKYRQLFHEKSIGGEGVSAYRKVRRSDGSSRPATEEELSGRKPLSENSSLYRLDTLTSQSPGTRYEVTYSGRRFYPKGYWKTEQRLMPRLLRANRVESTSKGNLYYVRYINDFPAFPINDSWTDTVIAGFTSDKKYVVETSTKVVERCLLMTTDPGDLVLDPTCGSATTATVAEQWGRRWITIDTSRVALALARMRLMSAKYPYYYLAADHPDLPLKLTDEEIGARLGQTTPSPTHADIKKGFIYRRIRHITLKSIANNPDIDGIYERWQSQFDDLRAKINSTIGKSWQEWEIPRLPGEGEQLTLEQQELLMVEPLLQKWWNMRGQQQVEFDAAIKRNADVEIIYDRPHEDKRRLRVSGQFTVESLSPHRTLTTDFTDSTDSKNGSPSVKSADSSSSDFTTMILDNLRKAGVQNTKKGERLKFDRLDAYPGRWLHAAGEYTDSDGRAHRVAVSIGPEHNTVGPQQIKDAAKEAVQGVGFDLLLVCGFAFDPHVNEEATRYGRLTVQPVRMNPDLAMGDELLKKTGAGNLFMIFGEPDLRRDVDDDGRLTVELLGLDIYDPTTGEIRSSSTDDIACWFIDTDYDGESFFVRHAYFTGADEPYDKLKRALRAEVDESAWAELYSTRSRPFDRPENGRIAVKVINHYGDEVLKVYEV